MKTHSTTDALSVPLHRLVRKFYVEWQFKTGKWVRSQIDQDTLDEAFERCAEGKRNGHMKMRVVEVEESITETIHIFPNDKNQAP